MEKGTKKIAEAEHLYETDTFSSWRGWPAVTALRPNDNEGSRNLLELQAADLVAWTLRFELLNIQYWIRQIKPTLGANQQERWDESLLEWLEGRLREQMMTYPESVLFYRVWHSLKEMGRIVYYPYDEERLENHIMVHRKFMPPAELMERTVRLAGRKYPLTP